MLRRLEGDDDFNTRRAAGFSRGWETLFAHQHDELQVFAVRGLESDLVVDDMAVARMIEAALAAFALVDVL